MKKNLNVIPMNTWNHMKVNYASDDFDLPAIGADASEGRSAVIDTAETISGVGADYDEWVVRNATKVEKIEVRSGEDKGTIVNKINSSSICFTDINVSEGGKLTYVEIAEGGVADDSVASLIRINAGKNSKITAIQITLLSDDVRNWNGIAVDEDEEADVEVIRVALGGKTSLYGSRAELNGTGSVYTIDTVYFGDKDRKIDFNDIADFYGKETHSDINARGVLAGQSSKVLRATVDFKRGSVHAVGHETEDVVMFSDDALNKTTPLILCGEEWVEGQHAATTTQLDERMLYYLTSRGLPESEAKRLMIDSKLAPVIDRIPDDQLKESIYENIGRRLDGIEEFNR